VGHRHLVYLTPDISDTSTIKRVEEFLAQGYAVTVVGFRRDRYNRDYAPAWPHVVLGYTEDGKYGRRVWAMLVALRALIARRHWFRHASVLYCRNVDQLLLSTLVRTLFCPNALLAYEILDVQPTLTGRGILSRGLRTIERACLQHVRVLVVSSPGFVRNYFLPVQGYRREWFLLENKVHPSVMTIDRAVTPRHRGARGYQWVVGYVGLIRGNQTLDLMARVAARLRDAVQFKFRGVLTTVDPNRFAEALAGNPNMVYEGDYVNPRDLGRIYGEIDLAWALDLENVDHNSRWLLPCRFYEAGLYGVPCLAMRDFEVGRLIDGLEVGWTFAEPLEDALVRFFQTLTPDALEIKRQRLLAMPSSAFVADNDIVALCQIFEREIADLPTAPIAPAIGPAAD
jgi:succinoglycan biosynthesis protein ExoL